MAGGQRVKRSGVAYTAREAAARHKRPCRSAPATPQDVTLAFRRREVHHKQAWVATAAWDAVTTDVADRPLQVELYSVQLRAVDASGDPVETQSQDADITVRGKAFTVHAGTAPVRGNAREINSTSDVLKETLTGLTAGIDHQVDFRAREDAGGDDARLTCYIRNVTDSTTVETKNATPDGTRKSRTIATLTFTPVSGKTYEARVEGRTGISGTALFDGIEHRDKGDHAVWEKEVKADGEVADDRIRAQFVVPRPGSWFYQTRVRVLNRVHGGRCWSAWTDWSTPEHPSDEDAVVGPPAPEGLALVFKKDSPRGNPWRGRVTWNESPHYFIEGGDSEDGSASYDLQMQVSKEDAGTVMHRRSASEAADPTATTNEHSFNSLRGRRWYRVRIRARALESHAPGAWSDWTEWDSPRGAPDPPQNVACENPGPAKIVVTWDPPDDATDVDSYFVRIIRQGGGGTTVKESYVGVGTRAYHWNIPAAERNAHPGANYRARVFSVEEPYSEEIDETPGAVWSAEESSSYEETTDQANGEQWTADDIDVTTLPASPSDGDPPASSPTPVVTGGLGILHVRWDATANADAVTYEVHVSDTASFTPDSSTLYAETGATAATIKSLGDDTPLSYDVEYYVVIIATDADGAAAAGTEVPGTPLQVNSPDIVAESITSALLASESITADKLAAVLIITSQLKTADSGRRVEVDTEGVRLIEADESVLVNLPTDDDQPATFNGELLAEALTATGDVELRADGNTLTKDAILTLLAGQAAPTASPSLAQDVESHSNPWNTATYGTTLTTWHDGTNVWAVYNRVVSGSGSGATRESVIEKRSSDGASVVTAGAVLDADVTAQVISIARDQDYWYAIVYRWSTGGMRWYVWDDSGAGAGPGTLVSNTAWNEYNGVYWPRIDNGVTGGMVVAQSNKTPTGGNYKVQFDFYDLDNDGTQPNWDSAVDSSDTVYGFNDIRGFYYGSADFGATRMVVSCNGVSTWGSYTTGGTRQSNETFDAASAGSQMGLWWDGTRFWEPSSAGSIYEYSTFQASGATSTKFYLAFTWYDSDSSGGTHETALSPRSTLTLKNRRRLSVTWPTIPDLGGVDDANAVRVYMKANGSDPGATFASYYRQGSSLTGTQTYLETYNTGTAGSQDTAFTGGTGAQIAAAAGSAYAPLKGNGDGFIPVGMIQIWPTATIPTGWLECNGQSVLRADYAALFTAIGTTYGSVDGTHFNVPNLENRIVVGHSSSTPAIGTVGGGSSHSSVTPGISGSTGNATGGSSATVGGGNTAGATHNHGAGSLVNAAHSHDAHTVANDALPPYLPMNYVIKT